MTKDQTKHMEASLERFQEMGAKKYKAGQKEHGGNLWQKPGMLDNMEEEVVDMWHYIQALRVQLEEQQERQSQEQDAVTKFLEQCNTVGIRNPYTFILSKQWKVYHYLKGAFPRGILPTDCDGEVEINGRFLRFEHKHDHAIRRMDKEWATPTGQTRSQWKQVKANAAQVVFVGESEKHEVSCLRIWSNRAGEVEEKWIPDADMDALRRECRDWAKSVDPSFKPKGD